MDDNYNMIPAVAEGSERENLETIAGTSAQLIQHADAPLLINDTSLSIPTPIAALRDDKSTEYLMDLESGGLEPNDIMSALNLFNDNITGTFQEAASGESVEKAVPSETQSGYGTIRTVMDDMTSSPFSISAYQTLSTTQSTAASVDRNSLTISPERARQQQKVRSRAATVSTSSSPLSERKSSNPLIADVIEAQQRNNSLSNIRTSITRKARRTFSMSRSRTSVDNIEGLPPPLPPKDSSTSETGLPSPPAKAHVDLPHMDRTTFGRDLFHDVRKGAFGVMSGHPLARLYLLIYLLPNGLHSLLFFRMDVAEYKDDFRKMTHSQRHNIAYKVYQMYLSDGAPFDLKSALLHADEDLRNDTDLYAKMIANITWTISTPTETLFTDLDFFAWKSLKRCTESKKNIYLASGNDIPVFYESAGFQMMRSDLSECDTFSIRHIEKIVQRILDLPLLATAGSYVANRIAQLLEGLKCDWQKAPNAQKLLKILHDGDNPGFMGIQMKKSRKLTSVSDLPKSGSGTDLSELASMQPARTMRMNSTSSEIMMAEQHPFVQNPDAVIGMHCEFCLKTFTGKEIAFRCQECQYLSHKSCRNQVNLKCSKLSNAQEQSGQQSSEEPITKLLRATHKYIAVDKEIKLSASILEGMEKMMRAKPEAAKNVMSAFKKQEKTPQQKETAAQLLQMETKITYLKNDKRRLIVQIASLVASPDNLALVMMMPVSDVQNELKKIMSECPDTAPIRVFLSNELEQMPNKTRKSLIITKNTAAHEVIFNVLEKDRRRGLSSSAVADELDLCFLDEAGNEFVLHPKDRPLIIQHSMEDCTFFLRQKPVHSPVRLASAQPEVEETQKLASKAKRLAVMNELIATEYGYVENLRNAIKYYRAPMLKSTNVSKTAIESLFYNLADIVSYHELIVQQFEALKNSDPNFDGQYMQVLKDIVPKMFPSYVKYCSNQNSAQRSLASMKHDADFAALLERLQSEPKLERLGLADILIQPMHRITRLPLLLKRLQNCTPGQHPDFENITRVIHLVEKAAGKINDLVSQRERDHRLRYLQKILNWNQQCDPFKLSEQERTLISEKPVTYVTKKQNVDLISFIFTDLIMLIQIKIKEDKKEEMLLFRPPIPIKSCLALSIPPSMASTIPPQLQQHSQSMTNLAHSSMTNLIIPASTTLRHQFQLVNLNRETHHLECFSRTDKLAWIHEIMMIQFNMLLQEEFLFATENNLQINDITMRIVNASLSQSPSLRQPTSPMQRFVVTSMLKDASTISNGSHGSNIVLPDDASANDSNRSRSSTARSHTETADEKPQSQLDRISQAGSAKSSQMDLTRSASQLSKSSFELNGAGINGRSPGSTLRKSDNLGSRLKDLIKSSSGI
eukprot:Partr_v1_DN28771_c2_g1_i2_m62405 putative guanine nucleotide exchange factor